MAYHMSKKHSKVSIDRPEEEPDDPILQYQRHMENKRGPIVFER